MKLSHIITVLSLTVIWIILTESVTPFNIGVGVAVGILTAIFLRKFLPIKNIDDVNFYRLITFPFYLIGQIYVAGFQVIWMVLKGSRVGTIVLKTKIKSEALKVILVDSITLTPGSVLIDLTDDNLNLLWIREKNEPADVETAERKLKARLERRLLKAQKTN